MGTLYKDLINWLLEDLKKWDWTLDDTYEIDEETGKALLELLKRREHRNNYYKRKYAENHEQRLEYQRNWAKARRRTHEAE